MQYIDVAWMHEDGEEPVRLVSELNDQRMEVRKLEFFRDGSVGFADACRTSGGTRLGDKCVPSLEKINEEVEFNGKTIDSVEFETLWKCYVGTDA